MSIIGGNKNLKKTSDILIKRAKIENLVAKLQRKNWKQLRTSQEIYWWKWLNAMYLFN